jgi:[ribosomal protein S18]-alanine N-acetyltransferase
MLPQLSQPLREWRNSRKLETLTTTQRIEVRSVRPEDLTAISTIEEASFKDPYPAYFLAQLADVAADTFLVGLVQGGIVGYAVVDEWTEQQHLVSIAVLPNHRRKGVGQALFNGLVERLREGKLGLELRRSNKEALNFYLKNGFSRTGVAHSYYADGEDAIQMEKTITKNVEILTPA